ncbi:MAG: DUF4830 domain-containing protein [Angelakisella sp.]
MFIYTMHIKKETILTALLAVTAAVLTLLLLPIGQQAIQTLGGTKAPRCETNGERVAWLESLGWEVDDTPCSELSVVIPQRFDELYAQYAVLQRQSGFHLEKQKGKTAQKYSYTVTNYGDGKEPAIASILQRGDKIIAADLSSGRLGGFLKPLLPRSKTAMG